MTLLAFFTCAASMHPLYEMVVNHDMHRPVTGKRHAETDTGSGEKAAKIVCLFSSRDISLLHRPKPTTRLTSPSEMKLALALLLVAVASAIRK